MIVKQSANVFANRNAFDEPRQIAVSTVIKFVAQ